MPHSIFRQVPSIHRESVLGSLQACTTYFVPRIRLRALVCSILLALKLSPSLCVERQRMRSSSISLRMSFA